MDRLPHLLVLADRHAAFLQIEERLALDGVPSICRDVARVEDLKAAMDAGPWDLVVEACAVLGPDFPGRFNVVRAQLPEVPVIVVSGCVDPQQAAELTELGVWDFLLTADLHRLAHVVTHALRESAHRRTERADGQSLRRSEERYRQLFANATDGLFVFPLGPDGQPGRYTEVNNAALELLGYTREELLRLSPSDVVDATERERLPANFQELLKTRHRRVELRMVAKDGRRIPVEISRTLFDLESQPTVIGIVRDVTAQKCMETAIRGAMLTLWFSYVLFFETITKPQRRVSAVNPRTTNRCGMLTPSRRSSSAGSKAKSASMRAAAPSTRRMARITARSRLGCGAQRRGRVSETMAACHHLTPPVLSHGGGTSLAGQCCNVAVVIDFTKYGIETGPGSRCPKKTGPGAAGLRPGQD